MDIKAKAKIIAEKAGKNISDAAKKTAFFVNENAPKVVDATKKGAKVVSDGAKKAYQETKKFIEDDIERRKLEAEEKERKLREEYRKIISDAIASMDNKFASDFVNDLCESPFPLKANTVKRIKDTFPLPVEQTVLWADCEIDIRSNGVVVTDKGVFFKTDVSVSEEKFRKKSERKTSELIYIKWEYLHPEDYVDIDDDDNKLMLVGDKCYREFHKSCSRYARTLSCKNIPDNENIGSMFYRSGGVVEASALSASGVALSAEELIIRNNGVGNASQTGHGIMAEHANSIFDTVLGKRSIVTGGDNAKNGADRVVNGVKIQSKYCKTPGKSVNHAFDKTTGQYRYINEQTGEIMKLEVPSDQYDKAVELMEKKIMEGKIPGATDPAEAKNIVRKGHFTYEQSLNMAKAGTIESLTYDVATGAVVSLCVFSISCLITTFLAYRKTKNLKESLIEGALSGGKAGLLALGSHVAISQLSRTTFFNNVLSKSVIGNGLATSAIAFAVFSIPETYRVATKKISCAQYAANLLSLSASIVAGSLGATAASAGAAAAGATAVGAAVASTAGGIVVGAAVGAGVAYGASIVYEGDDVRHARLFNAIVQTMICDYCLDEGEIALLISKFNKISNREYKKLFDSLGKSVTQEDDITSFLEPYFDSVVKERDHITADDFNSVLQLAVV